MILRLTKKARAKIKIKDSELKEAQSGSEFLVEWYVSTFVLDRKKYFIFTEAKTLYSTVLDSKGINSREEFVAAVRGIVPMAVQECFPGMEVEGTEYQSTVLAKTESRAIVGSQTDLIYMAGADFEYHGGLINFQRINKTPMSYLKYERPEDEFKKEFMSMKKGGIA